MTSLEEEISLLLQQHSLTLSIIESATGGLLSHLITNIPGSSRYYKGSVIAYSNEVKTTLLGIDEAIIRHHGAVSQQTAEAMAEGGKKLFTSDVCLTTTGIAGPGGATSNKPVGLFYIGLAHPMGTICQKYIYQGDREQNKHLAANSALTQLKNYLNEYTRE
jgi:nicotinamide-nucleotide amidase